jgi:hypothetical protein
MLSEVFEQAFLFNSVYFIIYDYKGYVKCFYL